MNVYKTDLEEWKVNIVNGFEGQNQGNISLKWFCKFCSEPFSGISYSVVPI